jgi:large subunit ribosomal protein L31
MKPNIHPQYYHDAQIVCSCGNIFTAGSTKQKIQVEVCYKCHPFYTGEKRYIDTLGQVEKFQQKQQTAASLRQKISTKKTKKQQKKQSPPKTLKELLGEI